MGLRYVFSEDDYSYVNAEPQTVSNPKHTWCFEPQATRSAVGSAALKEQVRLCGGYHIEKVSSTGNSSIDNVQTSNPKYWSCKDYYIGGSYAAAVNNGGFRDRLFIEPSALGANELPFVLSDLQPDKYLATTFNQLVGQPSTSYCGVGSKLFQTVELGELSGIDACHYAFKNTTLLAAFGVKAINLPWLRFPQNRNAARGVRKIIAGDATMDIGGSTVTPTTMYESPDLGEDGVFFTNSITTDVLSTANQISLAMPLTKTDWVKQFKWPGSSNDDAMPNGLLKFLSETRSENDVVDAMVVFDTACLNSVANYAIADLKSNPSVTSVNLRGGNGYLINNKLNQIFAEAQFIYETKLREIYIAQVNAIRAGLVEYRSLASGELVVIASDVFAEGVAEVVTSLSSNLGGSLKPEMFVGTYEAWLETLPFWKKNKPGVDLKAQYEEHVAGMKRALGLGDLVVDCRITPKMSLPPERADELIPYDKNTPSDTLLSYIKLMMNRYGADCTEDNLVPIFGEKSRASARQQYTDGKMMSGITQLNAKLSGLIEQLRLTSAVLTNSEVEYEVGAFAWKEIKKHAMYDKSEWSDLTKNFKPEKVVLYPNGNKVNCEITWQALFANARWFWFSEQISEKNGFWDDIILTAFAGWSPVFIGYGPKTYANEKFHFFNAVKDDAGFKITRRRWNYDKALNGNWIGLRTLRFSTTITLDVNANENLEVYMPYAGDTNKLLEKFVADAKRQAADEMVQFFAANLEVIQQASTHVPVVSLEGFVLSPRAVKQFFACNFTNSGTYDDILEKVSLSTKIDDSIKLSLTLAITNLRDAITNAQSDATTIKWLSEEKLSSATGVVNTNLLPLYLSFMEV